ncbi:MAG: helix-turn-helix transcriptional regulator [Oscillospiraceae bacterium]|nr:helix-turn-helix transcriptional regulator [Oscillospiraceae bacterium]
MDVSENKQIMARNIKKYMERTGVSNQQLCDALGFKYTTFMDWIKGVTYPRIGKVEMMANYFGCEKSDLIEDKSKEPTNDDDGLTNIHIELIELARTLSEEDAALLLAALKAKHK